jgi:hypothetical protein
VNNPQQSRGIAEREEIISTTSQSARGLAQSKTLRARRSRKIRASVLDCGGPPPLCPGQRSLFGDRAACFVQRRRRRQGYGLNVKNHQGIVCGWVAGVWLACPRRGESARGLAHSKTLRARGSRSLRASVLECGGPPPLFPMDWLNRNNDWRIGAGGMAKCFQVCSRR